MTDPAPGPRAYLAHLRHELRTPINAIIGYSELLAEEARDGGRPERAADLERIRDAGARLLQRVNQLLDPAAFDEDAPPPDPAELEAQLRHALRTPLSAVIGYAELLLEDAADDPAEGPAHDLGQIRAAGARLLERVGDIARLPGWRQGLAAGDGGDISPLVRDAIETIRPVTDAPAPPAAAGRVLVVDDDATNRQLLARRLRRQGYQVAAAENGREALERCRAEEFDVVLLDLVMPQMNGFELLARLKADARLRHVPVIMLSALDEIDSAVRCIENGAEDYLPKPHDPVLLRARLESSLEKKRLRDREREHLEQLRRERERSERLLLSIFPQPVAERLKRGEREVAESFAEVTVLFADLEGFTERFARVPPAELVRWLDRIFSVFDRLAEHHGMETIKTIGDAYLAVSGLPIPRPDHARAAAETALEMLRAVEEMGAAEGNRVRLRVGLHTGPVVAGVIGRRRPAYDLWGDTVNTASRMESHGLPGEIQVSASTHARLRDAYRFRPRGAVEIKGIGRMETYLLEGRLP